MSCLLPAIWCYVHLSLCVLLPVLLGGRDSRVLAHPTNCGWLVVGSGVSDRIFLNVKAFWWILSIFNTCSIVINSVPLYVNNLIYIVVITNTFWNIWVVFLSMCHKIRLIQTFKSCRSSPISPPPWPLAGCCYTFCCCKPTEVKEWLKAIIS